MKLSSSAVLLLALALAPFRAEAGTCKYGVEITAVSEEEPSLLSLKLMMASGQEASDEMKIGTAEDGKAYKLEFDAMKCSNVKGVEVYQTTATPVEIRKLKVRKNGHYHYGVDCFSRASCGHMVLAELDKCDTASAGAVKLSEGDMLTLFKDGKQECVGGPCDEKEREKVKSEKKCFDYLPTANLGGNNTNSKECAASPITCDDGDKESKDFCDQETGKCVSTCENDPLDLCTERSYGADGKCQAEPIACDDSDPNTKDSCEKDKGCVHSCTSDNKCKIPFLDDDMKCQFKDKVCDDGDEVTLDSCDPAVGCVYKCGNDNKCTNEYYDADGKCVSEAITCHDGDRFTLDVCDPAVGCKFLPLNENLEEELAKLSNEVIVYKDQPRLSKEDEKAILLYIKTEINQKNTPYCWKQSYGRGVGKIPQDCPKGKDKIGVLCYNQCTEGYSRQGTFDCQQECKDGWRDDGLFCRLAEYGRGAGYVMWDKDKCERENKQGCEKHGLIWYPKCKPGYTPRGCCICAPKSFDCKAEGYKGEFAGSCGVFIKPGEPTPTQCSPHLERDAGLCYDKCKEGFDGVGPVCWQQCDVDQVNCGAGCAKDSKTCSKEITDMIFAPFVALANVLSNLSKAGIVPEDVGEKIQEGLDFTKKVGKKAYAILGGMDASVGEALLAFANKAEEVADSGYIGSVGVNATGAAAKDLFVKNLETAAVSVGKELVTRAVKAVSKNDVSVIASGKVYENNFADHFVDYVTPEVQAKVDGELSELDALHIKDMTAQMVYQEIAEQEKWNTTKSELMHWTGVVDGALSGITGFEFGELIKAFVKPVCHEIHHFPALEGYTGKAVEAEAAKAGNATVDA